jgi:diadenosine tetraphosphate (Ap4A) HIT family hydrolase
MNVADCPFCYPKIASDIIEGADTGLVFAVWDRYPVTKGHTLVIPRRHVTEYFALSDDERRAADELMQRLQRQMALEDQRISGYNIGVNNGASAGQTIFHVHYHLIPRRDGDTTDPRGGVRGVMPGKRGY